MEAKSIKACLLSAFLVMLCMSLATEVAKGDADAIFRALWDQYTIATETGDIELIMSLWDDNGVKMGPDAPAVIGKDGIRGMMEGLYAAFDWECLIVQEEAVIAGDWGFSRITVTLSGTPKGGGDTITWPPAKCLDIFKKQADGSWKLYIDCYNFDAPIPAEEVAGNSPGPELTTPAQADDADAMYREMCDLYTLACTTGDVDLYVSNYTDDGVQLPPGSPILIGSEQIRARISATFDLFNLEMTIHPQEAEISGDWAFGRCDYSVSLTPKEGGPTTTFDAAKDLDIFKRQADGSWKYYISCWSPNGPPRLIPPEPYDNVFFMSLSPGLNMISLPLEPITPYTARSLAEEIGATVVIKYDPTLGRFEGFTPAASGDGFALNGGEGYIVNVPAGGTITFTGAPWTNEPPVEIQEAPPVAPTSGAWAFVVSGSVLGGEMMSASNGGYTAVVKNLQTGEVFTESVDPSGYFAAAWADLNRKAVIGAGDRVEVAVMDSNGSIVSGPFVHEVTLDAIRDAVVNVRLNLGDIIPAKSVLLQNYPNPFNPETWVPYHLSSANPVVVKIYSTSGQLIRTLDLGHKDAGVYASRSKAAYWDGKNEAGEEVASAVYFYSITAGDFSAMRKMVVKK